MKKDQLKQIIKEELFKVLNEQGRIRYVATMEFFVWGNDESSAKREAEQIAKFVEDQYDNSPTISNIAKQSFGTIAGKPIKTKIDYD